MRLINDKTDNKQETIQELKNFGDALLSLLYENLTDTGEKFLNSSKKYPFDKPFSEVGVDIAEWIKDIIEGTN